MKDIASCGTSNSSWRGGAAFRQVRMCMCELVCSAHTNWARREIHAFLGARQ